MRSIPILLSLCAALLVAASPAWTSGGNAEDPYRQQIKQHISAYRYCFYEQLPQGMAALEDSTPNEALADWALNACEPVLEEMRSFLTGLWDDAELAAVATDETRLTIREQALKVFEKAREIYPKALAKLKELKESQGAQ